MISLKSFSLVCVLSWFGCVVFSAHAYPPDFPRIQDINPTESDFPGRLTSLEFGLNLALDGNTLVATEPEAEPPRIAVFTRKSATAQWERSASLYIPVPGFWDIDWKGSKLAIDGDVVLAAIKRTVYVFKRTNGRWHLVQRVKPPSTDGVTDYPEQLAFDAGTAVITGSTPSEGVAYVYTVQPDGRLAWKSKLRSLSGVRGDGFGASVDIHNDTIAIGAPGLKSVFVFKRSGSAWKRSQQVMPIEVEIANTFGRAVAVNGNMLAVGAPEALTEGTFGNTQSGAVYVFAISAGSYTQARVLHPSPDEDSDYIDYGRIVRLTADRLIVTATSPYLDGFYSTPAQYFVYRRSGSSVQLLASADDTLDLPWDMVTDGAQLIVSGGDHQYSIGEIEVFDLSNVKCTN